MASGTVNQYQMPLLEIEALDCIYTWGTTYQMILEEECIASRKNIENEFIDSKNGRKIQLIFY